MKPERYDSLYEQEEYYWGTGTSGLATTTLEYAPAASDEPTVVDVGAGECRDAVFFAERGFEVYAVDLSAAGLAKGERLATERGVSIDTIEADANDFQFPEPVDVVHSSGAVQYIHPANRDRQFGRFKRNTVPGGINSIFAIVDHPETTLGPDWTENGTLFERDELQEYYADWEICHSREKLFDHYWKGESHQYAARIVVARKPE